MKATITITEQELEALDQLITAGVSVFDDWQAQHSPEINTANEWLAFARQAFVADQEQG